MKPFVPDGKIGLRHLVTDKLTIIIGMRGQEWILLDCRIEDQYIYFDEQVNLEDLRRFMGGGCITTDKTIAYWMKING